MMNAPAKSSECRTFRRQYQQKRHNVTYWGTTTANARPSTAMYSGDAWRIRWKCAICLLFITHPLSSRHLYSDFLNPKSQPQRGCLKVPNLVTLVSIVSTQRDVTDTYKLCSICTDQQTCTRCFFNCDAVWKTPGECSRCSTECIL